MGALSLRRRLTLLVAMAIVVPITVVGVMVVNLIGNEGDSRTFDRLRLTGANVSNALDAERARLERTANAFADDERLRAAVEAGSSDLEGLLRQSLETQDVDSSVVTGRDGAVLGGIRRQPQFARDVEVPPLDDIVAGTAVSIESAADASFGAVHTALWLDQQRLGSLSRTEPIALTLVSDDGDVLATTESIGALPDRPLTGEFSGRFGDTERFGFGVPVPGDGAVVLASSPPGSNRSRSNLVAIFGVLLVVLLVLVVLVGHVVSGLVTGPVDALVDAANAVSRGDLTKRVEPTGDEELVALGRAFNQMTDNLSEYVAQLQQSRGEFQAAISRLGDVLVSTHDVNGILEVVLEAATLTLKADLAVFYKRVAMPARLRASSVWGADRGEVPDIELNGVGVAGTAGKNLAPVTFPGNGWLDLSEPVVSSAIAVPVVLEGRLFGVLAVYGRAGESLFSGDDVDTLQTLARQTEVAIGNVMLHDETKRQARTDGLTGLWNRREFELRAREAVKEAERFDEPFGIVVADIDDFKQVNDRFDHTTGDAALIWLASRLSEATREIDVVARWGGEEFIVLLPRAGLEETATVAERVRAAVAEEPMVDGNKILPITVSLGFAVRPHDGTSPDELFRAADAALLRAKRSGKNRVEHAGTDQGVA
jgi:diguanylate cyclase (GGDEF)-like protein